MNAHTAIKKTSNSGLQEVNIGNATLYLGDSADVLTAVTNIDAVVADPPYGLSFMGKSWDYDVPQASLWEAIYDSMKPGAHLLSFFGSRTYHRGAVQIEDAGFDIRDQIMWLYGSGFPKSHNIGKAVQAEKATGSSSPTGQRKAAMGDAYEPTPLAGTPDYGKIGNMFRSKAEGRTEWSRPQLDLTTAEAKQWDGWGTALKPAHEPIVVARKPFKTSVAKNVLAMGTGALNIDDCRVDGGRWPANIIHDGSDEVLAQFPSTSSPAPYVRSVDSGNKNSYTGNGIGNKAGTLAREYGDSGSAARFFYAAKASKKDRDEGLEEFAKRESCFFQTANGTSGKPGGHFKMNQPRANIHPTVKPTELMRYLCRLVTPKGGVVLDPFMGSGSTGKAALQEGFRFVGIERDPDYFEIACARIAAAQSL